MTKTAPPEGLLDTILGPAAPPSDMPAPPLPDTIEAQPADPADNTFAVSTIKILGHPPQ